jgi:hypothetical protein
VSAKGVGAKQRTLALTNSWSLNPNGIGQPSLVAKRITKKILFFAALRHNYADYCICGKSTTDDIKLNFKYMKLLLVTGLIALSMVGYSRADGFGSGIGFGIGMALANRVMSGGQPRQRERVVEHEHRTVIHERTVVHVSATPAPQNTTVIVNNNLPAQPAGQPTSVTTMNARNIAVTNSPAQNTPTAAVAPAVIAPAQPNLANDVTVN